VNKWIALFVTIFVLTSSAVMAKTAYQTSGVVNLNTATKAELVLLPGIGDAKADAIISQRKTMPFKQKEDLISIKGVGERLLEGLKPYLIVTGPSTIKQEKISIR
jgi:competence protein ComEA